ncbi:hypothetical protein EVAR_29147_1 [Eumeta japonica]|uniref:Uncharacterized protein n=1 Tax=Eumeta variegata TaxID=151549 RepID=A0A4C1VAA5_EUMVA|nr:hypothetical protein EVAR_29147_1 [Eumeta japonica]
MTEIVDAKSVAVKDGEVHYMSTWADLREDVMKLGCIEIDSGTRIGVVIDNANGLCKKDEGIHSISTRAEVRAKHVDASPGVPLTSKDEEVRLNSSWLVLIMQ